MNLGGELSGLNTIFIGIGIVLFIALAIMIVIQSRILRTLTEQQTARGEIHEIRSQAPAQQQTAYSAAAYNTDKRGLTQGQTRLSGIEDEEHIAVIMAAVSSASNIPLSALKIRSIKKVDSTWDTAAKQERANQRL